MPDYAKLKVTELKEELGRRGLPKGGLKAELVHRLEEADAQAEEEEKSPAPEPQPAPASEDQGDPAQEAQSLQNEARQDAEANDVAPEQSTESSIKDTILQEPDALPRLDSPSPHNDGEATSQPANEGTDPMTMTGILTQPVNSTEAQLPTPSQTQDQNAQALADVTQLSTQTSLTPEEIIEDSRKRKRRSQSPPPSSFLNSQKKLRTGDAEDDVITKTNSSREPSSQANGHVSGAPSPVHSPRSLSASKDASVSPASVKETAGEKEIDAQEAVDKAGAQSPQNQVEGQEDKPTKIDVVDTSNQLKFTKSPLKSSPSDTRFKNLFTAPDTTNATDSNSVVPAEGDREVSPSIHPATSALYVRELMRPLNPKTVKDHLVALATSPGTEADSSIITEFFLDTIRTHCLVGFASVAAASRVRLALHDRIWPNERDRRALWVDFVPEDKLKRWIEVEQDSTGGRGQASKRWEVVYEDEQGEIQAYLQEAGSGIRGLRTAPVGKATPAGQTVQRAAVPPQVDKIIPPPRNDYGKGFQALDDLFKSTTAKPKLYYLPVSKREADHRLNLLSAARGGGRGDEVRRYTFEDSVIVDRGPERGRGGPTRYRGGRGGSYEGAYRGGRGGRYRGETYRDTGDGYRRPGYQ